ncbi:MAG: hypothetical protein MZV64_43725 [Ignavibacteriales bacterium]|nr:hypothetical protein [Ignavibacteriales bacterium]
MPRYSGTFRIKGNWLPVQPDLRPGPGLPLLHHRAALRRAWSSSTAHYNPMPALAEYWKISGRRLAHHLQAPPGRPLPQRPRAHGRGRQVLPREAGPEPAGQHLLPVLHPQGRRGRGLLAGPGRPRSPGSASSTRPPSRSSGPGRSAPSASTSWGCITARSCPRTSSRAKAGTSSTSPSARAPSSSPSGSAAPAWTSWASGSSGTAPITAAQALPLGHRVQPALHGGPVRGGERPPGHADVGAPPAPALSRPGERHAAVLLPGPELRRPAPRPAGGPPGPGPGARQGPAGGIL